MSPGRRLALAVEMSEEASAVLTSGIKARHPDYSDVQVTWAFRRVRLGDTLLRRVWPRRPPRRSVSAAALLQTVVAALDDAGIPNMLVGSFASMSHGAPRATQDIDVVIDPTAEARTRFVASFDPEGSTLQPQ